VLINHKIFVSIFVLFLFLSSCVLNKKDFNDDPENLAHAHHWHKSFINTKFFQIAVFKSDLIKIETQKSLNIYFEGDGAAWRFGGQSPPINPTPLRATLMNLAFIDHRPNVVYLARPCQYLKNDPNCHPKYWGSHRFSEEIITSTNEAIEKLKHDFAVKNLNFIGYSGGAAVALLVAARRNDVTSITTIAGNLDHKTWTALNGLEPLYGSLNPIDDHTKLASIYQVHLIGGEDNVINLDAIKKYKEKYKGSENVQFIEIPNFNHTCCWDQIWPKILKDQKNYY
jgi:hypothetical protein